MLSIKAQDTGKQAWFWHERTKKKAFLEQIDRIVPWGEWIAIVKQHYYKGERGNKLYDPELILRI